jgi:nuclear transport factor 2 (NTF2) superfamily protein
MEIYFDGYCPESLLKGKHVEMRLNEDDFWESEATGLQMTVFLPYAAILRWRGKGKFRQSSDVASNVLTGLVMTEAQKEDGKEIFPDEENIINNKFDLEWYLDEIYASKQEFDAAKFNPNDPVFEEQEQYLNTIPKKDFQKLGQLLDTLKEQSYGDNLMSSDTFHELHKMLYDLKLIFNFKWMAWHKGWKNINDTSFDYSNCSLLDLSMYLTAIFRADRFSDGTIEQNFKSGTLDKIFSRLRDERHATNK